MSADCRYEWCDGHAHEDAEHAGTIAKSQPVLGEPVALDITVFDVIEDDPEPQFRFHFDIRWWEIDIKDVEQEIADLQNMVDVFAAAMRKVKAEVEN